MEYISLYKLFFKEPDRYEKIYMDKINNECSIKFRFQIHDYPAFYISNNEMMCLINEIQQYNKKIITMVHGNIPEIAYTWFLDQTLIDEIKMTNDIEGVISTRREIQAILDNGHRSKGKRFFGLVNKYNKLIKEEYDFIISCQDIYNLYEEIMLADIKNENDTNIPDGSLFRKDGVDVYLNGRVIHQGILPESSIIEHMDRAIIILNRKDIPLLIRVAIFHYLFSYIHPYYDGNGRINRLIASYYLKQEMDVLCALQVSIGCKEQQNKYYEAFKICNDVRNRGDITPFILMFLEIYRDGLKRLQETIIEKVSQLSYYMNAIDNYKDSDLYDTLGYFIQSSLFARGGLTMKELGKLMGCSEPTVRNRIKEIHDTKFEKAFKIDTSHKPHIYSLDMFIFDDILSKKKNC